MLLNDSLLFLNIKFTDILLCYVINNDSTGSRSIIGSGDWSKRFLSCLFYKKKYLTVSQICNLILRFLCSISFAPNSTPIVTSCFYLNLLSMNYKRRQDFPTPNCSLLRGNFFTSVSNYNVLKKIMVRHFNISRKTELNSVLFLY